MSRRRQTATMSLPPSAANRMPPLAKILGKIETVGGPGETAADLAMRGSAYRCVRNPSSTEKDCSPSVETRPLALRRCAYTLPLCAAAVFSQAHNKLRSHSYHNSKLLVVADTDGRRERFRIRSVFSSLLRCQWGGKARSQSEAIVGPERIKRHASTLFRARQDCCRGLAPRRGTEKVLAGIRDSALPSL